MTLKFTFLNVNHGDCIVVEYEADGERHYGVIDSNRGPRGSSPALHYLTNDVKAERLSFVCITHPHKDHYLGLRDLLLEYRGRISDFYSFPIGDFCSDPSRFAKFKAALLNTLKNIDEDVAPDEAARLEELLAIIALANKDFGPRNAWHELTGEDSGIAPEGFGGVKIRSVLPPRAVNGNILRQFQTGQRIDTSEGLKENDRSIALQFRYAGRSVLLGGDGTIENWRMHKRYRDRNKQFKLASDIVKIPHHGSRIDCPSDVLDGLFCGASNTKMAVISANGNRHPHPEVIRDLKEKGITIRCTNLLRKWRSDPVTGMASDYSGLAGFLADYLRSMKIDDGPEPHPCKGDISFTIDRGGNITETSQFDQQCPCNPDALARLLNLGR